MKNRYDVIERLKESYGDAIYQTGIYKIYFQQKPKYFYIGLAASAGKFPCCSGFYNRWTRHLQQLSNKTHANRFLQRLFDKYGEQSIIFEIVEKVERDKCGEKEMLYMEKLKPPLNMYGNPYCITNRKVTDATKDKIRKKLQGRTHTEETKLRMSQINSQRFFINKKEIDKYIDLIINHNLDFSDVIREYKVSMYLLKKYITTYYGHDYFNLLLIKATRLRVTEEIRMNVQSMRENGNTVSEICKLLKMGKSTVRRILHKLNPPNE